MSPVLFLLADEHNPWVAGFMGHPCVRTPHLDALAARGTVFERAWTTSPLCVPARASLATGRYVHQHRYWDNAIAYDGAVPSWMQVLSEHDVDVDSIGKLHFRQESDPVGFRRQIIPVHIQDGVGQVWGSVRDPLPDEAAGSGMFKRMGAGESPYNRYDMDVSRRACDWLRERAREGRAGPWLLFCSLVAPHFPLVVPERYLQRVLDDPSLEACLPEAGGEHHPWVARMLAYMDHDASLGSDERRRHAVACYLALVEFMDERVGEVLDTLRDTGLEATTRVIYTSDHGDNLGARRLWNKGTLYRESTGVPMILAGPGVPVGRRCQTNVSLVDVFPTLVEALAPEARMAGLPGGSLWEIAQAPDDPTRQVFGEYHGVGSPSGGYFLADGFYKYHHYAGYGPELFDVNDDPAERHDLAGLPACADVLARLGAQLRAIVDPDQADRLAKDDQNALVLRHGGREQALGAGRRGATGVPASYDR
ncbi:MAG: sulfatase-like hydrolase/transferase [Pigmentiphaga sp.]